MVTKRPLSERDFSAYRLPEHCFIGEGPKSARLYEAERKTIEAIRVASRELALYHGWRFQSSRARADNDADRFYWHRALPAALVQVLESYQPESAIVAAAEFLRRYGVVVELPKLGEKTADWD